MRGRISKEKILITARTQAALNFFAQFLIHESRCRIKINFRTMSV